MDFALEKVPAQFAAKICGNFVRVNDLISKARVRIFYKGLNRNRTYITDEIGEQMVNSLVYVPVKGIYNEEDGDFTDHGKSRQAGQAYGLVPSKDDRNFAWEDHEDEDGETRTYACCDVYLWTGIYEKAEEIINHPQSMELNAKTILGEWKRADNGMKYFQYTNAEFLGLQCLGKDVEPCFEGAAFFSLIQDVQQLMQLFTEYKKQTKQGLLTDEGGKIMELNFKLSHEDIHSLLFRVLNPNANEQGKWQYDFSVGPVYDRYAIATSYEDATTYRVYYSKTEDEIVLGDKEKVYIVDVNASEYSALQALQALNGGTYDKVDENFKAATEGLVTANAKIAEQEGTINTLTTEKGAAETANATLTTELETANVSNATLTEKNTTLGAEVESLKEFKLQKETAEKQAIIDKFSKVFDDEEIKAFTEKMDTYTVTELEKDLSVIYVKKQESTLQFNIVPNADNAGKKLSGADTLIAKHVNKEENN